MQIHYMWINDFAPIQQTGINLSSNLIFEMQHLSGKASWELTIKKNPDYIDHFFDDLEPAADIGKISNVTAIIGKNGAGKTSILSYIKSRLPQGLESRTMNDLFVYSWADQNNKETYYIIRPFEFPLEINNLSGLQFEESEYGDDAASSLQFTGKLGAAEYIYYSYLLDFNEDMQPWKGLSNLSSAYLMMEERRRITEESRHERSRETMLAHCNDLDNLHMSEVARAVELLSSDFQQLPFSKPEYLIIEIDLRDATYFDDEKEKFPEFYTLLQSLRASDSVKEDNKERTTAELRRDMLLRTLMLGVFYNYHLQDFKYSVGSLYTHRIEKDLNESATEYILRFFSSMEVGSSIQNNEQIKIPRHEFLSTAVIEFYNFVRQQFDSGVISARNDLSSMYLKLDSESEKVFKKFSKLYLSIKGISSFLNFKWRSLSGGEQSYLSLMSRFYDLKNHGHGDLPRNLVIMIDEGDLGYHPEWQRKYLKTTLDFLRRLFRNHSMQVIMTANSPFISSDLPKANVLFIEKGPNGSIYHSKDNNRESTFGSNIHTLFSNSFYMDGVLMGDFAKARINRIIDFINDKRVNIPNADYKKTIEAIGEPVLRKKLLDMWFEKFGPIEEREQLLKRLAELNEQINPSKDDQEPA
ncbi:ATP-binding protein [Mucilaginibacter rubeus]|uniref:AAA domain-containing protein n=1 Tax=Mucilaginibacter rubeus TaxID=2027860 RepID=A0A5C1I3S1_9SPHI|nr:ATP-binding protein [Mucilaginibacter rubeus]QEM12595.1 hypothetical protein DEO27_022130 [Mucilaginibacter rubeus]